MPKTKFEMSRVERVFRIFWTSAVDISFQVLLGYELSLSRALNSAETEVSFASFLLFSMNGYS